jgi:hypothetical protein
VGSWIYWAIELIVITSISEGIAYGVSRGPFCEPCDRWYDGKKYLGNVPPEWADSFMELIGKEQFKQAGELLEKSLNSQESRLEVEVEHCSCCKFADLSLIVKKAIADKDGKMTLNQIAQGMISPGQFSQLQAVSVADPEQAQEQAQEQTQEQIQEQA